MATKVSSHSTGSWFPSGYYGHYRSKARTDFVNEYRQLAKPAPPRRFLHRSSQPVVSHLFSTHDNRNSFMCDASYFAQGLGKKRHPARSGVFDPDFIAWTSHNREARKSRPMTSTYRQDFRLEEPAQQLLTQRPKTSFDTSFTTMYRSVHGGDAPNREFISAMNNEALMLTSLQRQRQARLKPRQHRDTVASCLSWARPRPSVPASTPTTCYEYLNMRHIPEHTEHIPPAVASQIAESHVPQPPPGPPPSALQPCPPPGPPPCAAPAAATTECSGE